MPQKIRAANLRKLQQLGIPIGTATHKLRQLIMFSLIKRLGENVCHRCGQVIETAAELSFDHIEDWLDSGNPVQLFFDIDNVAFSHKRCNKATRTPRMPQNSLGVKGVKQTPGGRFRADIHFLQNGKKSRKYLGTFVTCEEASAAYDAAARQYHGSRAVTNAELVHT